MPQLTRDQNCLQSTIFPRLSSKQFHGSVAQKQNFNVYLGVSVIYMQIDCAVNVRQNNTIVVKIILRVPSVTTVPAFSGDVVRSLRLTVIFLRDSRRLLPATPVLVRFPNSQEGRGT